MTKSLFQSKIFWTALVSFVLALLGGFTHKVITPGMADDIVALDWSNIGQAALSLGIILFRWFSSGSRISGIFPKVASTTFLILALALLSSGSALAASVKQPYRAWQWQTKPAQIGIYLQYWCSPVAPLVS